MRVTLKYMKFVLSRSLVFYLLCLLLIWRMLNYHALLNNAIPQTMSRLTPPIDYFSEFVDTKGNYDRFKLMNCIYYHQAVIKYFPYQKSEAEGMLGFCYERQGQKQKAIEAYQKAIDFNHDYFWPYYNLGVIFYNEGKNSKALGYFQQAIEQSSFKTVYLLSKSKIYNDVKLSHNNGSYNVVQSLKQARLETLVLMMDLLNKMGSYNQLLAVAINGLKEGDNSDGIFYYYAGIAAYYQKYYPQSIRFLQLALQTNPNNPDAILYLGLCLKIAGQPQAAQLFIEKASLMNKQGISILKNYLHPDVQFF